MRPPRLVLLLLCFIALPISLTFFTLLYSHPRRPMNTESDKPLQKTGLRAFFSFHTPSSLFPPSAIISLTDDNSTFFLAKPAGFGPLLPSDGLSGQLWVGSGFGDDALGRGGVATGAEGELGCSDVPGWGEGQKFRHGGVNGEVLDKTQQQSDKADSDTDSDPRQRRSDGTDGSTSSSGAEKLSPTEDDGTDDHLHHPLPVSQVTKPNKPGQSAEHETVKDGHLPEHADIQSLQESAEIAGKIVILSRGGCGFLEKVKWVQRRGGLALIVGDNIRGGQLIAMYARGDTSNVTIPSLFTSHTTAHLLSSLIPPAGTNDDLLVEDVSSLVSGEDRSHIAATKKKMGRKGKIAKSRPTFTPTTGGVKPTSTPKPSIVPISSEYSASGAKGSSQYTKRNRSWLRSLASAFGLGSRSSTSGLPADSRRPPSSGRINWIISESWADEPTTGNPASTMSKQSIKSDAKVKATTKISSQQSGGDDFVIGVQDWRDPDLVAGYGTKNPAGKGKGKSDISSTETSKGSSNSFPQRAGSPEKHDGNGLTGGSITPGSGEYSKPSHGSDISKQAGRLGKLSTTKYRVDNDRQEDDSQNWLSRLIWGSQAEGNVQEKQRTKDTSSFIEEVEFVEDDAEVDFYDDHDGLWVTLTPTTISASPFFDTLLVLVVSPLVTLTVVYALLLLRSRIRRRRWRAPKSVVDRLPVRTYHTMSCASSSTSSQAASPITSSPTSPLLQSSPRSVLSHSRPRSRTTSGINETVSASLSKATAKASLLQREKSNVVPKRRYNGKQVECVVCLEEYIDGQSRVMSLPCGHEFHVECM